MTQTKAAPRPGRSRLFHLPRHLPDRDRMRELGRQLLNPGDRVVVETPSHTYDVSMLRVLEKPEDIGLWTVPGSLRITAHSDEPAALLDQIRRHLKLRRRCPRRHVSEWEVRRFLDRLKNEPHLFTRGAVNAQLDAWGRAALRHLRDIESCIWEPLPSGYVSYALRYIEDAFPSERGTSSDKAVVVRGERLLRYSVKALGEDGVVGYYGWPLRNMHPHHVSIFVSSAIDLVADWQKEEFLERAMRGLTHGGMMMTTPAWVGLSVSMRERRVSRVRRMNDVQSMKDINVHDPIHIKPMSKALRHDDFTLIARAAQIILDRKPYTRKYSAEPMWWRLRADPFGKRAAQHLIRRLYSFLRFNDNSVRIYSTDRWMGLERGCVMMLATDDVRARPHHVWGVSVDSSDRGRAREVRVVVKQILADFGRPASAPPSVMGSAAGANASAALAIRHHAFLSMQSHFSIHI